jgi:hypothetical protein
MHGISPLATYPLGIPSCRRNCCYAAPSGFFVRFKLPADILARVSALLVVRSLRGQVEDMARLTCPQGGAPDVDAKKLIDSAVAAAADGRTRDYTIEIPGVVSLRVASADDHARAMEALAALGASLSREPTTPAVPALPGGPPPSIGRHFFAALTAAQQVASDPAGNRPLRKPVLRVHRRRADGLVERRAALCFRLHRQATQ